MDYKLLGQNIKNERKKQKLTQEQLSENVGISVVFLSQIENDKGIPSLETIFKIASCLGTTIDSLLSSDSKNIKKDELQIASLLKDRTDKEKFFIVKTIRYLLENIDKDKINP